MNVLITGASGGLGRAYINECMKKGYQVLAVDINQNGLELIQKGMAQKFNMEILIFQCDITREESINELCDYMNEIGFEVDILMNVAGIDNEGGFLSREFFEIKKIIMTNIIGTLQITHKILSSSSRNRPFYMMIISSLAAKQPIPLKATYAASKRFLLDFSKALREELRGQNVNILTVCPGGLVTSYAVEKAIIGQGFFGAITTCNIEKVVSTSLRKLLRGKKEYIPGAFNKFTVFANRFIPVNFTVRILHKRWEKAQSTWLNMK